MTALLDPDLIEPAGRGRTRRVSARVARASASQVEVVELCEEEVLEMFADGDWLERGVAAVEANDLARALVDSAAMEKLVASSCGRDNALRDSLGAACRILPRVEGYDADRCYATAWHAIEGLGEDEQGDFHARARDKIARWWDQNDDGSQDEVCAAEAHFAAGLRRWPPYVIEWLIDRQVDLADVTDGELIAAFQAKKLGILATANGNGYYLIGPDASYRRTPIGANRLRPNIERDGLEWLIPLAYTVTKTNPKGEQREERVAISRDLLCETYSRTIDEGVEIVGGAGPNHFHPGSFGTGVLRMRMPQLRTDLKPTFHPGVDEWLRSLVLHAEFETFELSLGYMLALAEGPTAAPCLVGPPGSGKGLLARGLGECFTGAGMPASGKALGTNFNDELLHSPIVHIDEGFSGGRNGSNVADNFRSLVACEPLRIEPKHRGVIPARAAHRAFITVNNLDVLNVLAGDGWRTEDDSHAIGDRILIFHVREDAKKLLEARGGFDYTRGWVADDSGLDSSRFVIAKHLLWIYHNRLPRDATGKVVRQGKRFLIDGNARVQVHTTAVDSSIAPDVAEAINDLLKPGVNNLATQGAVIAGREVCVLQSAVIQRLQSVGKSLRPPDVRRALRGLADLEPEGEVERSTVAGMQKRWIHVDASRLLELVDQPTEVLAQAASWRTGEQVPA